MNESHLNSSAFLTLILSHLLQIHRSLSWKCFICLSNVGRKTPYFRASLTGFRTWFLQLWGPGQVTSLSAAAAAKSLQSCPTLSDPIDGSPPGSFIPGILQARVALGGRKLQNGLLGEGGWLFSLRPYTLIVSPTASHLRKWIHRIYFCVASHLTQISDCLSCHWPLLVTALLSTPIPVPWGTGHQAVGFL